jgi:hypothetical protein
LESLRTPAENVWLGLLVAGFDRTTARIRLPLKSVRVGQIQRAFRSILFSYWAVVKLEVSSVGQIKGQE